MTVQFGEEEDKITEDEVVEDINEFAELMAKMARNDIRVQWLSCDSDGEIDEEASEGINPSLYEIGVDIAGESHERTAAFEAGDIVVTLNPYTGDILMFEGENEDIPQYFEILEVDWDGGDDTYRYLLSGTGKWAAEGWLDIPDLPVMMKTLREINGAHSVSAADAMKAQIDELTTDAVSNSYLDMMNSDNPATRTKGLEGLKAMAAEGVI